MRKLNDKRSGFLDPGRQLLACSLSKKAYLAFVLFAILSLPGKLFAQTDLTKCYGSCTANDFTIVEAFLTDINGNRITSDACSDPSATVDAYLSFTFENTTNSDRNGIFISGTINGDYIYTCFSGVLPKQTTTTFTDKTHVVKWKCGSNLTLKGTFIAWGSAGESVCDNTCEEATPSKCRTVGDLVIVTPLVPNFIYAVKCETGKLFQTVCFTDKTAGGSQSYTYKWEFGDGTTSTDQNPCHNYSAAGDYVVKLTVTDAQTNSVKSLSQTVTVAACCSFEVTCPTDKDLGTYDCKTLKDLPAIPTTVAAAEASPYKIVIGDNPCGIIRVSGQDDKTPSVCSESDQTITRTILIYDDLDKDNTRDDNEPYKTCTFTYVVKADKTAPVITGVGSDQSIDCGATPQFSSPTATDNCDASPKLTYVDVKKELACGYSITRTWTATDACNNSYSASQTISVADTKAPVITCPKDVWTDCKGSTDPSYCQRATATDNCDQDVTITYSDSKVAQDCGYKIIRTWKATDDCGNYSECKQTIYVVDKTPPVITCPKDVWTDCKGSTDPSYCQRATATDNCDQDVTITYSDSKVAQDCGYKIIRTWKATDDCGNYSECKQTIYVVDKTPPVITCPKDVWTDCKGSTDPSYCQRATATDNCDQDVTITYSDSKVAQDCGYKIIRTWKATDDCGNYSECKQTIYVVDKTPPVITCPKDVWTDCKGSTDPSYCQRATATDNCDQDVTITYSDSKVAQDCGYKIIRTWKATDDCGNYSECKQTIYVVDKTPPVITCPKDVWTDCKGSTDPSYCQRATATDNCDQDVTITYSDSKVAQDCGYKIIRTWKATDDCGNYSECKQTIYVVDKTPPVITCPKDVWTDCKGSTDPSYCQRATATDNCDQDVTITYSDSKVAQDCGYKIIRTWKATDDCGNYSECKQTIYVVDKTPPVITCPKDVWTDCKGSTDPSYCQRATATDNCDQDVTITYSDSKVAQDCGYKIIRTWKATDDCGNYSECKQTIYVVDKTPPVITCPKDIYLQCGGSTEVTACGRPVVVDNCDQYPYVSYSDYKVADGCGYKIKRTWTAKDHCGNSSYCVQYIYVKDTKAPTIYCPADITLKCYEKVPAPDVSKVKAYDNCSSVTVTWVKDEESGKCPRYIYRTYQAKDKCGNTSYAKQKITVPCCTYCTYTQGFYGNKNGLAQLPSLLTTPLTIGRSGHSLTIPANTTMVKSAVKLNSILPGGSTPKVLKAGDCNIMNACLSQYLTSQGKINNVLLSQTITLSLNVRQKGGSLLAFPIQSGYITTSSGGCVKLNSNVVKYLTAGGTKTATVSDLLNLANDVLGWTKTAGVYGVPSLSDINSAVDAINNVFDGCRTFTGYKATCPTTYYTTPTSVTKPGVPLEEVGEAAALTVQAYPNPYMDKVKFVIESPVSGQGSLDVYNLLGQKVQTVFQGHVNAGKQTIEYNVPPLHRINLVYRLQVGTHQATGKLIHPN